MEDENRNGEKKFLDTYIMIERHNFSGYSQTLVTSNNLG